MRMIDADALIEALKENEWITNTDGGGLEDIINDAPTVVVDCKNCDGYEAGYSAGMHDTERPQGEWKCPKCGEWLFACPNCGADMRGDENE